MSYGVVQFPGRPLRWFTWQKPTNSQTPVVIHSLWTNNAWQIRHRARAARSSANSQTPVVKSPRFCGLWWQGFLHRARPANFRWSFNQHWLFSAKFFLPSAWIRSWRLEMQVVFSWLEWEREANMDWLLYLIPIKLAVFGFFIWYLLILWRQLLAARVRLVRSCVSCSTSSCLRTAASESKLRKLQRSPTPLRKGVALWEVTHRAGHPTFIIIDVIGLVSCSIRMVLSTGIFQTPLANSSWCGISCSGYNHPGKHTELFETSPFYLSGRYSSECRSHLLYSVLPLK